MAELCQTFSQPPWRALRDRLALFLQFMVQIVTAIGHLSLLFLSPSRSFVPLSAVELQEADSEEEDVQIDVSVLDSVGEDDALQKLTVVLDLDETLVCAYESSSLSPDVLNQAVKSGLKWFELECFSLNQECEGSDKINYVTVFKRPGLDEFLQQLGEFADLILFTAAQEDYAKPLVDRIDTENRFRLRLYRPSTITTKYLEHVKDLSCLSNNPCRTVLVDNNPFSFLLQPLNGIPCFPFSVTHPHDTQLMNELLPLLRELSCKRDVRPVLEDKFHMPDWFENHGIPVSSWTFSISTTT